MPAPKIAATYTGHPSDAHQVFLEGIPARDLTADEVDALSDDRREALLANAASEHAIYTLHGRDLKAEAKDVAAVADVGETMTDPVPATDPAPASSRGRSAEPKSTAPSS